MKAELRRHLDEYWSRVIAADLSEVPAIKSEFYKWYNSVSELITLKEEELAEARKLIDATH